MSYIYTVTIPPCPKYPTGATFTAGWYSAARSLAGPLQCTISATFPTRQGPADRRPETRSQDPANFTTPAIETRTLGQTPVWEGQGQHPIADHIFNILANRQK